MLTAFKRLLCLAIVARVFDHLPVGERCQVRDPQVNAHILIAHGQRLWLLYLTGEDHIPLIDFALDRDRLDRALDWPMESDPRFANFGEVERSRQFLPLLFCREFPTGSIGIGEAFITVSALEARIAWSFTVLDAPEEGRKRFIQAAQHILKHVRGDFLVFRTLLFDVYQITLLPIEGHRPNLPASD